MVLFYLILLRLVIYTHAIDLNDDMKLERLVAKHCEKYVTVKTEELQDKHDAEITTLKSELSKSKIEMDIIKRELKTQRKQIETLTANIDRATRPEHFSDSSETLTENIDQTARPKHLSDSHETLTANIDQSTKTKHFYDSSETLKVQIDQPNKLKHLSNSTTEVLSAKIDRSNSAEHDSHSAAEGSIQFDKMLTREAGRKVVETRNVDDQQALLSNGLRIRRDVHRVAFFAYLTNHAEHLRQDQDIVFDYVVTNIGNAYSGNHGVFTAPVQGTYVFSCTLMDEGSATTWGHFVVNNNIVAKFYLSTNVQASQTIVVSLNAGDDVSIKNTATDRSIFGGSYSTFSGFLLYGSGIEEIIG